MRSDTCFLEGRIRIRFSRGLGSKFEFLKGRIRIRGSRESRVFKRVGSGFITRVGSGSGYTFLEPQIILQFFACKNVHRIKIHGQDKTRQNKVYSTPKVLKHISVVCITTCETHTGNVVLTTRHYKILLLQVKAESESDTLVYFLFLLAITHLSIYLYIS